MRFPLAFVLLALASCATPRKDSEIPAMSESRLLSEIEHAKTQRAIASSSVGFPERWAAYEVKLREEILSRHPDWPDDVRQVVRERRVGVGMTPDQVRASWGLPDNTNQTLTTDGASEQWVYGYAGRYSFVYFEGGVVVAVQS